MNSGLILFDTLITIPYNNINPKMGQPFVHVILKFCPPLLTKYVFIMGFMMITQYNA
jgi:hypothetical protein